MVESDIENIEVYFDGACEPVNPGGIATFGFVIYKSHAPRPEGRGLPQASLCVTRRRGKCEMRKRNPRSS